MPDYILYGESVGANQKSMARVIRQSYPFFNKMQMSIACNPERNALQLIPAAEELLVKRFGPGPGLSISPELHRRSTRSHGNKAKPNCLTVRVNDQLKEQLQDIYQSMCFRTMQDLLEAALGEFVRKYGVKHG